ncbi:MAG TPA: hypothetical protein VE267_13595, partial [Bradyrhizobium sp.]|nr:hypothetical protein [Bradyrhizobium sp.]
MNVKADHNHNELQSGSAFLQKRTTLSTGIFVEKFRDEGCRPSRRPLRKGFLRRGYLGGARHSHLLTRYED